MIHDENLKNLRILTHKGKKGRTKQQRRKGRVKERRGENKM
jgi:hypothetical protein